MSGGDLSRSSLLDLFRLEADAQVQVLTSGLLALERDRTARAALEACTRAAHSLKGAARIVNLETGVRLTSALEDCFVAAQEGRTALQQTHIDLLLDGVDLLSRFAAHAADASQSPDDDAAAVDQWLSVINDVLGASVERLTHFDQRSNDVPHRLYDEALACRMRPVADGVQGFPRMVRDLAGSLGKQARLEIEGDATQVDRDILSALDAPLGHLLRNAVVHGLESPDERAAAGKPAEGVVRLEARHNAGALHLAIADDGRGVDMERLREAIVERGLTSREAARALSETELLEFLFLPGFTMRSTVTGISGRGFGLDVVRNMVKEADGAVHVSSRAGQGTRFRMQLPVTPVGTITDLAAGALREDGSRVRIVDVDDLIQSADTIVSGDGVAAGGHRPSAVADTRRKRVLVVDDSPTVRELERKLLGNRGYDVEVAVDGVDGWNAVRTGRFNLVVTDIDMPRMDGIELVTLITKDPNLKSIPVLVVSYKDRDEDRRRGLEAGAACYLTKSSFHDETLVQAVVDLIGEADA